jgi:competence protein ComEA
METRSRQMYTHAALIRDQASSSGAWAGSSLARVAKLSRSQLLVYAVIAIAVLLVGARWIRSSGDGSAEGAEVSFAADSSHEGEGTRDVVVHVAGDVARPGVYRLPAGSRVTDAVRRAGGFAGGASQDAINLAARLSDGQQVVVPGRGTVADGSASAGQSGPISLGSATVEQLDGIEGIGPITAQKIIEFRDQHGGLSSIAQLDEVEGIGPSTMESLRAALQP